MPKRRRQGVLDALIAAPWWISVILAGIVSLGAQFWLPTAFTSPLFAALSNLLDRFGAFAGIPFLLIAVVSALDDYKRRKLLVSQKELDDLRALTWQDFEVLVAEAYRVAGYQVTETGSGPDGGIDLVLKKSGLTTVVQCKRWKTRQVGVSPIRELYGVMVAEGADAAIFVCSGGYTAEAMIFAKGKAITLVDGPDLLELVERVQGEANAPIGSVNASNSVASDEAIAVQVCPKCGSDMVLREAKKGARKGEAFWGCSQFPKCRGTLNQ